MASQPARDQPARDQPQRDDSVDDQVYADAKTYYTTTGRHISRFRPMYRTYSQNGLLHQIERLSGGEPFRRGSHDVVTPGLHNNRRFLVYVDPTLATLQTQEDTDGNWQITIEDNGPKVLSLRTLASAGYTKTDVRGTYMLSNLLQELTMAQEFGRKEIILDESRLNENPVDRLSRLIKTQFWDGLTRRLDASTIDIAARDPKDWTSDPRPRIYVPIGEPEQLEYYNKLVEEHPELGLDVRSLPPSEQITPRFVQSLNSHPGILALEMDRVKDPVTGKDTLRGVPFVVPGGRFNEFYGWDSYMESLGLLVNDRVDLARAMVRNFCFSIRHYGKILNANRSYYLARSQPPFLTDMALRVYEKIKHESDAKEFLQTAMLAAIKEYFTIWACPPRYDEKTGLSRYRPGGAGMPPECEPGHFDTCLRPFAQKHNMTIDQFREKYDAGEIEEPELDEYLMHDRAMRESGHDTSYRLEDVCANLATIDLNSLLFKYETDFARTIRNILDDKLIMTADYCEGTPFKAGERVSSAQWDRRAKRRRISIDKYLWNEEAGMYFDYDTVKQQQCTFEACTTLWALWAGVASPKQAADMVAKSLRKFEVVGGLLATTEASRGPISANRPQRQWDYPYGWAPQQMLAWTGLIRYGFMEDAERLVYKWLYVLTKAFVDFNGVVVEKYDITRPVDPHRVNAEYGNQGLDFRGVAKEGFGWVNASYVYGLQIINGHMRRALGATIPYETFLKATERPDDAERAAPPPTDT